MRGLRLIAVVALAGCTSYTPAGEGVAGFFGGFNETPLAQDAYRINASGNAYTSRAKTNAIAMVRAAELARENGYERFLILSFDEWSKVNTFVTNGQATTNTYGTATAYTYGNSVNVAGNATSYTTYSPPQYHTVEKPRTDIVVKFVGIDDPAATNALSVDQILAEFGPRAGYKPRIK